MIFKLLVLNALISYIYLITHPSDGDYSLPMSGWLLLSMVDTVGVLVYMLVV